jgi:hypothetical protein
VACARISDEFGSTLLFRLGVNDARRYDRTHDVLRPATSFGLQSTIPAPFGERLLMRIPSVSPAGRTQHDVSRKRIE